jgi:glycopeptide antibiotics resistance protein
MEGILFFSCVLVCVLIPTAVVYAASRVVCRKKGLVRARADWLKLFVFAVYIAGVFFFTGAGTLYNIRQYGMSAGALQYSLVPFSAQSFDVTAYLLNIVLFLPLGFLLPLIWPKNDRFGRVLLFGAAFSLLIELSQLLNIRSTDIDDLLLNTLGAALGFLLFRLYRFVFRRKKGIAHQTAGNPVLYLAAMYASYFFLFNELGFAKLLYGF